MASIFTRTYIAIALLMVAAFMLTVRLTDSAPNSDAWIHFVQAAQAELNRLQTQLQIMDSEQWDRYASEFMPSSPMKISLRRWYDSPDAQADSEPPPDFMVSSVDVEPWWVLQKMPASEYYLMAEALPNRSFGLDPWAERYIPIISVFLALGIGIAHLARRISRPVLELTDVAKRFGGGDLSVRARIAAPAPINELAHEFNRMANQLDQIIQDQQVMIGAIPHELRLPLSRMRFALDLARDTKDVAERERHLGRLDRYVNELAHAVEDIIFLTRTSRAESISLESFDLIAALREIQSNYSAGSKKLQFGVPSGRLIVTANPALIKRALGNLISNALRHAHSEVVVHTLTEDHHVVIRVEDDGSGIPFEKRSELFTPFMRLDDSRDRRTGGVGLGLAIVALIMRKHNGHVEVLESTLGGACFELRWPAANPVQ